MAFVASNRTLPTVCVARTVRQSLCCPCAHKSPSAADDRRFFWVTGSYQMVHDVDAETVGSVRFDKSLPMTRPGNTRGRACLNSATEPGILMGVFKVCVSSAT